MGAVPKMSSADAKTHILLERSRARGREEVVGKEVVSRMSQRRKLVAGGMSRQETRMRAGSSLVSEVTAEL